jgi:hypothetical protein
MLDHFLRESAALISEARCSVKAARLRLISFFDRASFAVVPTWQARGGDLRSHCAFSM